MSHSFKGVFAPLTTPYKGEAIALSRFEENVRKYDEERLAGYVILGSTGESVYLTDQESFKLVSTARKAASRRKKIIAGTGCESTRLTIDFTNKLADLGVDAALVRTPFYFKDRMTREALKSHFLRLADQARVPILVYNYPQLTGISVDAGLVSELSGHPNIAGIKDSSGNLGLLGEIIPRVKPPFSFLVGAGSVFLPGLELGASGGILALADVAPGPCARLYDLFQKGRKSEALRLQFDLIPLNKAVTQTFGIAGVKYAMDLEGFYGGPVRAPLLPLRKEGKTAVRALLQGFGLIP